MIPYLLFQIALVVITVRAVYTTITGVTAPAKNWLDILYNASIAIAALAFLLGGWNS
ncbi:hypothetical protein MJA45_27050 [Paenibacillus aurantius]|uniref:Uncharacterized protein n=1 Tax=Paenibacillus aurantius TaxID=2918900 RepID=A0AA96RD81_9BACL|nr:hypothetical protein [Paenibacillus aurantius]WJH35926.1 hypothetical protein N6H14_08455 [Paenibacillus sp. CC-CFT747]WNQ11215.1 hypothetical protein MJA45_27050 [Paenibacillus aurantius]